MTLVETASILNILVKFKKRMIFFSFYQSRYVLLLRLLTLSHFLSI